MYTATSWIIQKLKTDHKNKNDDQNGDQISLSPQPFDQNNSYLQRADQKTIPKTAKISLHKNKNDHHSNPEMPFFESKSPLEKIDEKPIPKTAKISLMMPGYFKKYIESIEKTIFESSFFHVCGAVGSLNLNLVREVKFWHLSRQHKFRVLSLSFTKKDINLAARVFVMPDTKEIKKEFEALVKTELNGYLLDEYCEEKNIQYKGQSEILDCCYILPVDKEDFTMIDRNEFTDKSIDKCRFELNKKIDKTAAEIIGVDFSSYINRKFK